jgi:myo-inositol-1(or 4)-monophosphatase
MLCEERPGWTARRIAAACREAGALLRRLSLTDPYARSKGGHELVTRADFESEDLIRERLTAICPEAAFAGEESFEGSIDPPVWLVDPLDGTNNFAHGYPVYSVSAALLASGGLVAGCVHDPTRRETFLAWRGGGALLNGRRISCSGTMLLEDALLATGFPYTRKPDDLGFDINPLLYFLGRVRGIRRSGSAALDLCYVSCGRLDGYWEQHLRPWDMAAGVLVALEAGACVEAYAGGAWTPSAGGVLTGAPGIIDQLRTGVSPR